MSGRRLRAGLAALLLLCGCGAGSAEPRQSVRIAVPASEYIQNINENYYKRWLEEQSGLNIEFTFVSEPQTEEYLRLLFSSGSGNLDAVFFSPELQLPQETIHRYGEQGYVLPLDPLVDAGGTNLSDLFDAFPDYDLRTAMAAADGRLYFMPSLNRARLTQNRQVFWINMDWLKALGLSLPQTTGELRAVLEAFATRDPNGNGARDEIPMAGCATVDAKQVCHFLINSFVYYNPQNSGMAVTGGRVRFNPVTDEYRQALVYLNGLYADDLLPPLCFGFSEAQLTQLVNDPRNAVGGFAAASVTDVIYRGSTDTLSNYIHLSPLQGPQGARYALPSTPLPLPGGVITATCRDPQAVFRLMDLMLGEEASRIASYGEQGVDWDFAQTGDISITGGRAALNVKTRLSNKVQNKHLAGLGPGVIRAEYADNVSWSGMEADNEYIDSRAAVAYRQYEPEEYIPCIIFETADSEELRAIRAAIDAYTDEMLEAFVTGRSDPGDDDQWRRHTRHYESLQLPRLVDAVQASYDSLREWRATH